MDVVAPRARRSGRANSLLERQQAVPRWRAPGKEDGCGKDSRNTHWVAACLCSCS
jgi:hypothetical protein